MVNRIKSWLASISSPTYHYDEHRGVLCTGAHNHRQDVVENVRLVEILNHFFNAHEDGDLNLLRLHESQLSAQQNGSRRALCDGKVGSTQTVAYLCVGVDVEKLLRFRENQLANSALV